jgi:receptor protein-tyrosine kinase
MSRVHDALRRAEQAVAVSPPGTVEAPAVTAVATPAIAPSSLGVSPELLKRVPTVPFNPARDSHIIDLSRPHETPAEEFRTLRTRLNHLQTQQPIHTVVLTSASPAEGKSFAAVNLAIAEAQLENNTTLLIDCDFRRPVVHSLFQIDRSPGLTDFLQGKAQLHECIRRLEGSNLYVLPAGEGVVNPLELLNRIEVKLLMDQLPRVFNWVLIDSPPLLFAADGNLLSTLCSATILVVRMGSTTIDSVTRAMQSLCENNVIGIIVNGARRGELYSKYTYYHSYYYAAPDSPNAAAEPPE